MADEKSQSLLHQVISSGIFHDQPIMPGVHPMSQSLLSTTTTVRPKAYFPFDRKVVIPQIRAVLNAK
jgi:hypothetical protein